jgi:serine/threonine-protein kinase
MGEVYRARDSKLGREVALKVVLDAFVADRDRQTRFEREARALAALNHPHIATLHGMEEAEGRHFLVMELVEGPTLQDVVERDGPSGLPVERALAIAIQIADALDAAHEKGIVHRDLKPANVKVGPDDKVKVLDFGLAKSLDAARDKPGSDGDRSSPSWSLANSPTMTNTATAAGMILGTASYMSPEQARGQGGDHRSDIFSFGVVLFAGETVSDVLALVLAKDPDLSKLPAGVSPRISSRPCAVLGRDRLSSSRVPDVPVTIPFSLVLPQLAPRRARHGANDEATCRRRRSEPATRRKRGVSYRRPRCQPSPTDTVSDGT